MKVLLVNPEFPVTYWGFQYSLPFSDASVMLPPLGLITLAALLPAEWELRLVDLNVGPLDERSLYWADAVFVGGMRVQGDSMRQVMASARRLDRLVVVGGPAPTTAPEEYADAHIIFQGEAEGRIDELVEAMTQHREGNGPAQAVLLSNDGLPTPDMTQSPTPRFDLLPHGEYDTMSIQYSRGCPYRCEFCDIIEIYGRVPRVKSADQVITEMEALRNLGWRGAIFVVDDNFIGNRPAVRKMLPILTDYQKSHGQPFDLATEASVNLASDHKLVAAMVEAGFTQVFLGIETPSEAALKGTQKTQTLRIDLMQAVESLCSAGLEVMAGFIVGFDEDGPEAFEAQRAFIQASPIPIAMAGLLIALPGTQLWRRLDREGRLRAAGTGDQFGRPNFAPAMDEEALLVGYAKLLADIYEPAAYFERCQRHALRAPAAPGASRISARDLVRLATVMWTLGLRRPWRRHFWKLLLRTLRKAPHNLRRAMVHAVLGEHMIRYTQQDVLPRIASAVAEVRAERAQMRSPSVRSKEAAGAGVRLNRNAISA